MPQTFEPNSNGKSMEERLRALEKQGESAFGAAQRSGKGGATAVESRKATAANDQYRQRAASLAKRGSVNAKLPDYQTQAQRINQKVVAREVEAEKLRVRRELQQRHFERQFAEWQRRQKEAEWKQQQERLRQQAIAKLQEQEWRKRQQQAQIRWAQQQRYEQMLAQQRQQQLRTRQPQQRPTNGGNNGWGGWKLPDLPASAYDGGLLPSGSSSRSNRFYRPNDIPGSSGR